MKLTIFFFLISIIVIACSVNDSSSTEGTTLSVSLKMEVLVLDSVTHMNPRRSTMAHLYSAIINESFEVRNEEFSDTTTCPNGWAVKELNLTLNENEKILLGITTKDPENNNYIIQDVTYRELAAKADENNYVTYKKTFNIYE